MIVYEYDESRDIVTVLTMQDARRPRRRPAARSGLELSSLQMLMYGRKYWGALRATFVIDGSGKVAHVIPRVTPRTHDDDVLAVLEQLAAT